MMGADKFSVSFAELMLNLIKETNGEGNVIISPVSVLSALNLCAVGAEADTKAQILSLFEDTSEEEIIDFMSGLKDNLASDEAKVSLANCIFADSKQVTLNEEFAEFINDKFNSPVFTEDFAKESAADKVNLWVKENTDGLIDKITDSVKDLCMIILNALSFDGQWINPFPAEKNVDGIFYGNEERTATYMNSTENCYVSLSNAKGFVKSYFGGYSFVGILPDEGLSVGEVLSDLDGETLLNAVDYNNFDSVEVTIPKFDVKSELKLREYLINMGVTDMFDGNKSDFSKVCVEKVCADDVIHKCAVKFNEAGTKAAAVTAVGVMRMALPVITHTLKFDREFLWLIIKDDNKLPIFGGVVKACC